MEEIIRKHFGEERIMYYQSSDAYQQIAGDTFLRYEWHDGRRVLLTLGADGDETPIKICSSPEDLDNLINAITR